MASTISELARELGRGCVSGWAEAVGATAAVLVSLLGPPSAAAGVIEWEQPMLFDEELSRPIETKQLTAQYSFQGPIDQGKSVPLDFRQSTTWNEDNKGGSGGIHPRGISRRVVASLLSISDSSRPSEDGTGN
ncbi:hypothetical protein HRG_003800 [Hirsutella rhossiliensis]|uniref:Uncharacterized protein n=1 Tax=Hirsutella rhossiliensis TaxID=111463 RepID=A0A9P8N2S2_9HYPO|nr:uncharacterized protein HRG_03800 [Hirsutella rhossiliensis]KAH0965784.1 hypothetical protein HRG_03800 [Hirsutella rhossiliensis]